MIDQLVHSEMDLCEMLNMMKLAEQQYVVKTTQSDRAPNPQVDNGDTAMTDDHQSDTASEYSTSSSQSTSVEFFGCAYLQAVQAQMDTFPDSGSQYLDTIFAHREIFMSFPTAHPQCSRGFSDMAYTLEQQAWKEERAVDNVAVAAFRHEAWSIAASLRDVSSQQLLQGNRARPQSGPVCHMAPM
ncbi:hypothetical protein EYR40_007070 [Pleurotus pulmonarius]|nr:hypothetical protein EYR40_007070 [Pleurotus pulmonarius]